MKITLASFFFATMTAGLLAADTPAPLTVAVYDITGEAGAVSDGGKVTALVTADLTTQTNIVMLERAQLDKALNEQAFGISGLVSSSAAAKIGAITGAKVLVSGEVIKTKKEHLVIIANIIGTETGRLFAVKVEGAEHMLPELTLDLSSNIAQTIVTQATNLIMAAKESSGSRLDRVIKNLPGTNRPSVVINIMYWGHGKSLHSPAAEGEFGAVFIKAGFPVVDSASDRKPDVEIKGIRDIDKGPNVGQMCSARVAIELKVQDRRTGEIITIDHADNITPGPPSGAASDGAMVQTVDELCERILPLLAK